MIKKGTLVLINSTGAINDKLSSVTGPMSIFATIVKEFHGKLMLASSDEANGLVFMKKFSTKGWVDVFVSESLGETGLVPFPVAIMDVIDTEVFCSKNLEDVVLIKRKLWFWDEFGNDLKKNPNSIANLEQLFKFHGKVLKIDWNESNKTDGSYFIVKKFLINGWEHVFIEEGNPKSGFLKFPKIILDEFDIGTFFNEVNN